MNHFLNLLSTAIRYYSRNEIKEAIFSTSLDREFVPKILVNKEIIFGSRPNALSYKDDLDYFIKSRAVSFHISEERWNDISKLTLNSNDKELNSLRKAWDLIIDIDFPVFDASKLIADEIIKALIDHGIRTLYLKFSGNKGFHIAVPFEVFPKVVRDVNVKDTFPELPSRILSYLSYYIDNPKNSFYLSKKILSKVKVPKENISFYCLNCNSEVKPVIKENKYVFVCKKCGYQKEISEEEYLAKKYFICDKCKGIMELSHVIKPKCPKCNSTNLVKKVNLGLDSILISKRHLFRAPYSLHEKSLLVSLPIKINDVLTFKREFALPKEVKFKHKFLPRETYYQEMKPEATRLFIEALDFTAIKRIKEDNLVEDKIQKPVIKISIKNPITEEFFPPCIKQGLRGLNDGRKRFLFVLINFLHQLKWSEEDIINFVNEWNKRNPKPLRSSIIKAQLNYHLKRNNMPPNCNLEGFYLDIGICKKDDLCDSIRNPVSYAIRKYNLSKKSKKTIIKNKKYNHL